MITHRRAVLVLCFWSVILAGLAWRSVGPTLARPLPDPTLAPSVYLPIVAGGANGLPSASPVARTATATATSVPTPVLDRNDVLAYVKHYRAMAGVPPVALDATLNENCYLHARYIAEENHLTHDERTDSPWYTPQGQSCAQKANVWLGGEFSTPYWEPHHSVEGWMGSVGHRLWLLYPTTPVFGYGFYTAANNRAGAALDVLSRFDSGSDGSFDGWPVRYPAPGQEDVPAEAFAITVSWRYFGPPPMLTSTSLATVAGTPVAHTATNELAAGHKGIQVVPSSPLASGTTYVVTVTGTYDGQPFDYVWSFSTE